jgi:Holliday junction resolvase RusA-like endonuclease
MPERALSCSFTVDGIAVPQGSMKGYVRGGHAVLTSDNPNLGAWRQGVAERARQAMLGMAPCPEPVQGAMDFYLPRPRGHYGTGKNAGTLRAGAPVLHTKKPDVDKLARAVLDGMTGIVFLDDAQVWSLALAKHYVNPGDPPPRAVVMAFS